MRTRLFKLTMVMFSLMVIFTILLSACGSKFPTSGQLEKTISGHTLVLEWEGNDSCMITILEKEFEAGFLTVIFEPCTGENVAEVVEGWKNDLSDSAPAWQKEAFDQFIVELRR